MTPGIYLTLAIATTLAAVRMCGVVNVFFKDAAHIYIGGLFGAAIVLHRTQYRANAKFYFALAIVLTVIETLVALISRFM